MSARTRRFLAWGPAAAYMLLIWGMSSFVPNVDFSHVPFHDKGIHFVEYGTLSVLLYHAIYGTWRAWRPLTMFASAVALTVLWGITDEIHQAFVPGRSSDVHDVIADAIGAFAGAVAYLALRVQLRSRAG
ncbi:MAG TPA: VanZ family protein [Polyangiales bacterium]|jgi:VanZ family protein|nr:VanZ family protein [Polyangiales bacterium]